jgi:hypothetical protein
MALFDKMTQPVVLKEDSSLNEQLRQLTELSQKSLPINIHKLVEDEIRCIKAGINGEEQLLYELKNSHIPMFILRDLCLDEDGMFAQIDFVIITRKLFFIIESKDLQGNIEIDSNGNFIRTMQYDNSFREEGIYSPITQNQHHLDLLRHIRQKNRNFLMKKLVKLFFNCFNRSVIVLTNSQTILNAKKAPKKILDKVVRADQLIEYIKKEESKSIVPGESEAVMHQFAQKFLSMHKKQNKDYAQEYLNKVTKITSIATEDNPPICSICGAPMIIKMARRGRYAGEPFFGCTNYPKCENIVNL